jgi:hypothetical protein
MFIGHYGASFAAKAKASELNLGWLFLAVQGLDLLFGSFVLIGLEHVRIVPGFTAYNPYDLYDIWVSHSLVGSACWSGLVVLVAKARRLPWSSALLLGGAVFSHFLLDLPVHVSDLPIAGAHSPKLGFGLWNHLVLSLALELACFGVGAWLYARQRRVRDRRLWGFLIALGILTLATPFMPDPASSAVFATESLAAYIGLAALAAWVDRSDGLVAARR